MSVVSINRAQEANKEIVKLLKDVLELAEMGVVDGLYIAVRSSPVDKSGQQGEMYTIIIPDGDRETAYGLMAAGQLINAELANTLLAIDHVRMEPGQ